MLPSIAALLGDDYVTVPSVPVLDEHVLTAKDGDAEAVIDAAFLETVADNCNARFATTGDAVPLVIGHTRDGVPETEQPPVVGYATDFRVGDFANTGRQALYCTFHVRRDREAALRDYPRRSVELWVRKREIDPISLLGATTPERDLGILRYSRRRDRDSDPSLHYRRECPMLPTQYAADDADAAMKDAAAGESAGMREIADKLDALPQMIVEALMQLLDGAAGDDKAKGDEKAKESAAEGDDETPEGDGDDDLLGPDDDGEADAGGGEGPPPAPAAGADADARQKDAAKFHQPEPVRFGSPAGGNSTYLPRVTKMQRSDDAAVKLQRQLDAQQKQFNDLKLKYARSEAEKTVKSLEDEGFLFADRGEEVEVLARLDPSLHSKWTDRVRRNYKQEAPTKGTDLARYSRESAAGDTGPKTPEAVQAEIAALQGKSWQEIEAKLWPTAKK